MFFKLYPFDFPGQLSAVYFCELVLLSLYLFIIQYDIFGLSKLVIIFLTSQ